MAEHDEAQALTDARREERREADEQWAVVVEDEKRKVETQWAEVVAEKDSLIAEEKRQNAEKDRQITELMRFSSCWNSNYW